MEYCYREAHAIPHDALALVPIWLETEANKTSKIISDMDWHCIPKEVSSPVDSLGKEIWNGVCGSQMWQNGLLLDKGYENNWNHSCQGILESSIIEEWMSKEVALQELMHSEGSDSWSEKADASTDEHELDILSTLAAAAAMFGEWCALDAEVPAPRFEVFEALVDSKMHEDRTSACDLGYRVNNLRDAFGRFSIQPASIDESIRTGFDIDCQGLNNMGASNHHQIYTSLKSSALSGLQQGISPSLESVNTLCHGGNKPHDAFWFVFPYLSLQDILRLECTCKTLKDWLRIDVPLWQHVEIRPPLSHDFTNEMLLNLTSRANGQLSSLTLVECLHISEEVVENVVYSNPTISKLYIPGCIGVSPDAVVRMVAFLSTNEGPRLKQLKLGSMFDLRREHYESLLCMLGSNAAAHHDSREPQYYCFGYPVSYWTDQRVIDVEECPKCTRVGLVYDCTRTSCQQTKNCRACRVCVLRCGECGRCIRDDDDYIETFFLENMCSSCYFRVPKCTGCHKPGTCIVDD